jgi:S1-C subfamily serine protease
VVAEAPSKVEVRFIDSDYIAAQKVYLDPQVDLALIRIPVDRIPDTAIEAELGCYETPRMGNAVVIFGHPGGLNFTGTRGIISGTTFVGGNESLQTDAPLNSGNSGGPLISIDSGKVVGVSEARFDAEDSEGLNLTVSIDHACRIIELIEAGRDPSPPALPIVFIEHNSDSPRLVVAQSYYADRSLLRGGDVIVGIDGSEAYVENVDQLKYLLRGSGPNVGLVVYRDGSERVVSVPITPQARLLERRALAVSGMTLLDYAPIDREEGRLGDRVIVAHSTEGSESYNAWFESRDSIYTINGARVESIDDVFRILEPFDAKGEPVSIVVRVPADGFDKVFDYHELSLEVRDLEIISH